MKLLRACSEQDEIFTVITPYIKGEYYGIKVLSLLGEVVYKSEAFGIGNETGINSTPELESGIYFVWLEISGRFAVKKVVIK